MIVVHANWVNGALRIWAESLMAWVSPPTSSESGDAPEGGVLVSPHTLRHVFAVPSTPLIPRLAEVAPTSARLGTEPATLRLRLPVTADRPLPSDQLLGYAGEVSMEGEDEEWAEPSLMTVEIPAVTFEPRAAMRLLLELDESGPAENVRFGESLRYWIRVARFALELLVDQRFIPTLFQTGASDLTAAWQPWLDDETTRARASLLLSAMPPVARAAIGPHDHRPWPILHDGLRGMIDGAVRDALISHDFADALDGRSDDDQHVVWLRGLLADRPGVTPPVNVAVELIRNVRTWIAGLEDAARERPVRLVLRLVEPDELFVDNMMADEVRWRLELGVAGPNGEFFDAETMWRDPASVSLEVGNAHRVDELFLAELGRAARLYPKLESVLKEGEPSFIELTTTEASAFLDEAMGLLEESGFVLEVPAWRGQASAQLGARLLIETPDAPPTVGSGAVAPSLLGLSSLVQYRWQVAVGDQPISLDELRELTKSKTSLVRVNGRWVELKPAQMAVASDFFKQEPEGEMTLLSAIHLWHGAADEKLGLPVIGLDASGWVGDLLGASGDESCMPSLPQPRGFLGTLRPYQQVGLSWLSFLDHLGLGACLADDMGLGKTIQLIALLLHERETAVKPSDIGPTLLVVPTSVVSNWEREIGRFAPNIRVHVHHGPDRPSGAEFASCAASVDVIITTYTLVSRDRDSLMPIGWHRIVLDEAQYIKNPPTKQTATIRALKTTRRIALTGTPVENRLTELWSIMEFCNPGYLGPAANFRRRFSVRIERHRDQERAEQLRRLVRPLILRRLKTDPTVIDDLPPCVITKEYATLSPEQAKLYERTVNEILGRVSESDGIQRRGLVLAMLVKLKQICNHPAQIETVDPATELGDAALSRLSGRSGKASRLMTMLEEVVAVGDKALLFTQFRKMGHLLSAMIRHDLDSDVMFLHGGTPPKKRQQMIDRFQDPNGGIPIFVLSLKAGGIGVNLTAANHVFHYDRWWNPAVENQATDRAFRIGQTRTVHVHKFVCMGTLEERIDQMIEQKTELAKNIIGSGEDWLTDLTTGQLRELLTLRGSAMDADS